MNAARSKPIEIQDSLGVCGVREDTRLLAELAGAGTPGRALDLGTGSGYVAIHLAQRGWRVDAVDVSERALDLARENVLRNGAEVSLYRSNLFDQVQDTFDVIAFNPPMRADETEGSRIITATLRRVGFLANLLMRVTQPVLERKRLGFLEEIARGAQPHLESNGRLLLVISPLEEVELPRLVSGLRLSASSRVEGIPGLNVATFQFEAGPHAG